MIKVYQYKRIALADMESDGELESLLNQFGKEGWHFTFKTDKSVFIERERLDNIRFTKPGNDLLKAAQEANQ